jgi:hypothetical protein
MKKWSKRAGKLVLLLLLAELLFFFVLGTRIRRWFEGPRELLGEGVEPSAVVTRVA